MDEDNSETLSVVITVPSDELGPVGYILELSSVENAILADRGNGVYEVTASGANPRDRQETLSALLLNKLLFQPRPHWASVLTGANGIKVEAVSTEAGETAPSNSLEAGTLGDIDTRTEKATTYVDITVIPIVDLPYLANERTVVQENKGDSNVDQELFIPIGSSDHLGMGIGDIDDSQSLHFELTGFPTNARSLQFGISKPGVTTVVDDLQGSITVYGEHNVLDILAVLDSLQITLAHDDDKNFLIEINGVAKDTNGVMVVSEEFYLSHEVVVQAVADTPTLEVGTEVKELVMENSSMEEYAITIRLNDIDGSESFKSESIDIRLSTPTDIAVGADPIVTFGTSSGVEINQTPGHVSLIIPISLWNRKLLTVSRFKLLCRWSCQAAFPTLKPPWRRWQSDPANKMVKTLPSLSPLLRSSRIQQKMAKTRLQYPKSTSLRPLLSPWILLFRATPS